MPLTAPDSLPYPDATDPVRVWEDLQELAEATQAALTALKADAELTQLAVGGGATLSRVHVTSALYDPPSIPANTASTWVIPLPAGSCALGDVCLLGSVDTALGATIVLRSWRVTAADEVTILVRNESAAAQDMAAQTFHFVFVRKAP